MPVKKASGTSETSIIIYQTLRYHIRKDNYFQYLRNYYSLGPLTKIRVTYVVQQYTQQFLRLNIYSQYVWQLDMFRTYRSILRSIYKLCVASLVCEDCVLLGASVP